MTQQDAPKVKAWSMIEGHSCPICYSKRIGVICYVQMKLICVICKNEFFEELELSCDDMKEVK
jgi:hypothetical protein